MAFEPSSTSIAAKAGGRKRKSRSSSPGVSERRENKKTKPKRPMTAYNYFFQEERRRILNGEDVSVVMVSGRGKKNRGGGAEDVDPNSPKRITFEDLGRIIGERWRDLDGDALASYSKRAAKDSDRYQREMKRYYEMQVSAMCHGYNDPVPNSLFRNIQDDDRSSGDNSDSEGEAIKQRRGGEGGSEGITEKARGMANTSQPRDSSGAEAAEMRGGALSSSNATTALLQQLIDQQQRDQVAITALLRQGGVLVPPLPPGDGALNFSGRASGATAAQLQQQQHPQGVILGSSGRCPGTAGLGGGGQDSGGLLGQGGEVKLGDNQSRFSAAAAAVTSAGGNTSALLGAAFHQPPSQLNPPSATGCHQGLGEHNQALMSALLLQQQEQQSQLSAAAAAGLGVVGVGVGPSAAANAALLEQFQQQGVAAGNPLGIMGNIGGIGMGMGMGGAGSGIGGGTPTPRPGASAGQDGGGFGSGAVGGGVNSVAVTRALLQQHQNMFNGR